MSLLHKLPDNLNKALIYQRISAGQAISFPWDKTSTKTRNLVQAYSNSLGCPDEYIFFPLLTVAASFIGTNGTMQINDSWEEPAIVWFNVCSRKGQKKTAALNVLAKPVGEIQKEMQNDFKEENGEAQEKDLPRLLVDHFSFEKLHQVMSQNDNKVLGAYDELTQFYNMLDHYKTNSTMDRKTLLALNGGAQWTRDFKNGSATMDSTCLNITGFIQPAYVVKLLSQDDFDGFNDRQLYVCPAESDVDYDELVPFDSSTTPELKQVYEIIRHFHSRSVIYQLNEEAHELFRQYHDELKSRKLAIKHDENRRGIIAKAIGQMARVCMIVHVLDTAITAAYQEIERVADDNHTQAEISPIISKQSALQAIAVMNYVVDTKFAMMPPEEKLQESVPPASTSQVQEVEPRPQEAPLEHFQQETLTDRHAKYVKKVLLYKGAQVKASDVSGRHLMPAVTPLPNSTNRYPTTAAENFLKCMEGLGLGEIVRSPNNRSRESCVLRKRPLEDMTTEARNKLRKVNVTDEQYNQSFC